MTPATAELWDEAGRRYLDGSGGAVVVNVGHGRAEVAEAIEKLDESPLYAYRLETAEGKKYAAAVAVAERYRYLYDREELAPWVPKLLAAAAITIATAPAATAAGETWSRITSTSTTSPARTSNVSTTGRSSASG